MGHASYADSQLLVVIFIRKTRDVLSLIAHHFPMQPFTALQLPQLPIVTWIEKSVFAYERPGVDVMQYPPHTVFYHDNDLQLHNITKGTILQTLHVQ